MFLTHTYYRSMRRDLLFQKNCHLLMVDMLLITNISVIFMIRHFLSCEMIGWDPLKGHLIHMLLYTVILVIWYHECHVMSRNVILWHSHLAKIVKRSVKCTISYCNTTLHKYGPRIWNDCVFPLEMLAFEPFYDLPVPRPSMNKEHNTNRTLTKGTLGWRKYLKL